MSRVTRLLLILLALIVLAGATGAFLVRGGLLGNLGWVMRERYAVQRALVEAYLRGDRVERDVAYVERAGWTGRLDLYLPRANAPTPMVVYFHGGGWTTGSRQLAALSATRYRDAGFAVANVSYRRTGEAPAPAAIEDARCALRWLLANASRLGIDTARIVTAGHSAGGHLALMAAMLREADGFDRGCAGSDVRAAAVINWYGPTDLSRLVEYAGAREFALPWLGDSAASESFRRRMSPVSYANGSGPTIVTIHGSRDDVVPVEQARRLHERLEAVGARHRLLEQPDGVHSFSARHTRMLLDSALAFLRPSTGL